jgi:hypothetical protein
MNLMKEKQRTCEIVMILRCGGVFRNVDWIDGIGLLLAMIGMVRIFDRN